MAVLSDNIKIIYGNDKEMPRNVLRAEAINVAATLGKSIAKDVIERNIKVAEKLAARKLHKEIEELTKRSAEELRIKIGRIHSCHAQIEESALHTLLKQVDSEFESEQEAVYKAVQRQLTELLKTYA